MKRRVMMSPLLGMGFGMNCLTFSSTPQGISPDSYQAIAKGMGFALDIETVNHAIDKWNHYYPLWGEWVHERKRKEYFKSIGYPIPSTVDEIKEAFLSLKRDTFYDVLRKVL